eukprot:jgi/Orpsp1_1/1192267/evm.model.d7180000091854.1
MNHNNNLIYYNNTDNNNNNNKSNKINNTYECKKNEGNTYLINNRPIDENNIVNNKSSNNFSYHEENSNINNYFPNNNNNLNNCENIKNNDYFNNNYNNNYNINNDNNYSYDNNCYHNNNTSYNDNCSSNNNYDINNDNNARNNEDNYTNVNYNNNNLINNNEFNNNNLINNNEFNNKNLNENVLIATRRSKQNKEKYKIPYKEAQERKEQSLKINPVPIRTLAMNLRNNNNDDNNIIINESYNNNNNNIHNKNYEQEQVVETEMEIASNSLKKVNFNENLDTTEGNNKKFFNKDITKEIDDKAESNLNNKNKNPDNNNDQNINNGNTNHIHIDNENTNDIIQNNTQNINTEKLEYLDLSYINQPNIAKIKKINKTEKVKEILSTSMDEDIQRKDENIPKVEKHIKMIDLVGDYDISELIKDVANMEVKLKLAHLLDLCPKFRTGFNKEQKLTKSNKELLINALSFISNYKVIKVNGSVERSNAEIFLDSCASLNLITSAAFEKYKINKPAVGTISERIYQAYSNNSISSDIYELEIQIGNYSFKDYFRKIEKDDIFDILIGIDTLKKNRFVLDLVDDVLLRKDMNNEYTKLTNLMYDVNFPNNHNASKEDSGNNITRCDGILDYCANLNVVYNDIINININDFEIQEFNNYEDNNTDGPSIIDNNILFHNINSKICPAVILLTPNEKTSFVESESLKDDKKCTIVNNIIKEVPTAIKNVVKNLFSSYADILAVKTDDLGNSKLFPHRINLLPGTRPIKQRAYRLSKTQADALKTELIKLINNKLIVPSSSPWSSPVVLVLKKNGQVRMCVDYRVVNNYTKKDAYALPLIDDILYYVGNTAVLSTIDLFSGYHQIPMHPEDRDITCFTTMYGNFNFQVMPFGLCNAPATFQREMNRIFFDLIGDCVFVYIDDLVVYSPSMEQHIKDLEKVFYILHNNGLKINLEKCHFFKEEVELLGHKLSTRGISPIDAKVNIIIKWLPPKNIKQLRSFLGAISYYRKFIGNFAQMAK